MEVESDLFFCIVTYSECKKNIEKENMQGWVVGVALKTNGGWMWDWIQHTTPEKYVISLEDQGSLTEDYEVKEYVKK